MIVFFRMLVIPIASVVNQRVIRKVLISGALFRKSSVFDYRFFVNDQVRLVVWFKFST